MRRWTWLWAWLAVLGVMALVLVAVALLAPERQESRPVDPNQSETPAGTVPAGEEE